MAKRSRESVCRQVQKELEEIESSEGLPFRQLLDENRILAALESCGTKFRKRIFTPVITLWAFLSQTIARKDSSCGDAVSRVIADRVAHRKRACSTDTSSYCQARMRLPSEVVKKLVHETGQGLHRQVKSEWLWKGRRVVITDGSTGTMADTPENQAEYPQSKNQKPGLGFPILRFVILLSLATGTALECAMGACRGKHTGEQSLFRQLWDALQPGEILLGDRLYDSYRDIALLNRRGVDSIFGKKESRRCDFRLGRKLGKDDHVVVWKKPKYDRTRYSSREEWESLPEEMEIREVRVKVRREGYRTRIVVIVTTLLDPTQYSAKDLTDLFSQRWNCELDLRSIKRSLGMYHLKCETPEMVRKELWIYLLAYNLIRVRMAQAAAKHDLQPRMLSFHSAKTLIDTFAPYLNVASGREYDRIEVELIDAIAQCRLRKRPGRKEPRAIKRREKKYEYLTKPRDQARKRLPA